MTDFEFFQALAAVPNLPEDLRRELGRRQLAAHRAMWGGGTFRFARTGRRNEFDVDGRRVRSDAAGMQALSFAVLNPDRDVPLGCARSRRAWRAAIERALALIEQQSPGLARALAVGESRQAGVWLQEVDGRIWARWSKPAGVRVTVS